MTKRFPRFVQSWNRQDGAYVFDRKEPKQYHMIWECMNIMNELHEENQIKLEIVDAFILGMEDEKGIAPENKEFQCRMNHTIKVLKELKKDMLNPSEFKRLKRLEE